MIRLMRRGEIWWADLAPPIGQRFVVLVSRDRAYDVRDFVMIAPITGRARGIPAEVPLGPEDGLSRPSVANCDSLATVARVDLRRRVAMLRPDKLAAIDAALRYALGLSEQSRRR